MSLVNVAVLLVAGSSLPTTGDPPAGAPSGVNVAAYGSPTQVRVYWTNGDTDAYTRVYTKAGGCSGGATLVHTAEPGVTSFDSSVNWGGTGTGITTGWICRHYRNGVESADSNCVTSTEGDQF